MGAKSTTEDGARCSWIHTIRRYMELTPLDVCDGSAFVYSKVTGRRQVMIFAAMVVIVPSMLDPAVPVIWRTLVQNNKFEIFSEKS